MWRPRLPRLHPDRAIVLAIIVAIPAAAAILEGAPVTATLLVAVVVAGLLMLIY